MTLPLWTLFVAVFLPYVWFSIANPLRKAEFGVLDNRHPRLQEAKQTGMGARANAASLNAFEALAIYTPAVLVAHVLSPESALAPKLAVAWLVLRVAHGAFYVADKPAGRTASFALATLCAVALFLVGAHVL
ncbi:MAG TPA: MAPEG family protein [Polyangiaceae bacterium]|jgi:uncharacterized MAPEG superfamily protein|nr:MAPEG family protein [Polyangiaceae bacterium]